MISHIADSAKIQCNNSAQRGNNEVIYDLGPGWTISSPQATCGRIGQQHQYHKCWDLPPAFGLVKKRKFVPSAWAQFCYKM